MNAATISVDFPYLQKLCRDFGVRVIETPAYGHADNSTAESHYALMASESVYMDSDPISPEFQSLDALDNYARENMIDILHDHLFGGTQEAFQTSGSYAR